MGTLALGPMETYRIGDVTVTDHTLTLPLSPDAADARTIDVFARVADRHPGDNLPYLVFLQGGPGCEAPRPWPSWMDAALKRYRVVLLNQRGTGRSTPVSSPDGWDAEYLSHLRADGIIRDAEAFREHLGAKTWSVLGQSFGGFSTLHYLSVHPESLDRVYFTGGLSAVGTDPAEIYATTYDSMRAHSEEFYRRYGGRDRMEKLIEATTAGKIVLPDGEVLSLSRLRSLGLLLGSDAGWLRLRSILDFEPGSAALAHDIAAALPYTGRNPLYYVLHESSYADGFATNWAAQRVCPQDFRDDPTLLTGEHVDPEWLDTVPAFKPWKQLTEQLAAWQWPSLYSASALRESGARGAAAVYVNDAFVPLSYSLDTAALVPGVRTWVTSTHEHSGLRSSNGGVLSRLISLADGALER